MIDQLHGREIVCANPKSQWFGCTGVITNANAQNVGVHFDADPSPTPTGRWIGRQYALPLDSEGVPDGDISEDLRTEMSRINEWRGLLKKAKESAVLAVDVYNRSGITFRASGYIVLMLIAWTAALLAKFRKDGVEPYYQDSNDKFIDADGSPKTWATEDCVRKVFPNSADPIRANLEAMIRIRNKIVHAHCPPLDMQIYGECQALLTNFIDYVRREFSDAKVFEGTFGLTLQVPQERTPEQLDAIKRFFGRNVAGLLQLVERIRDEAEEGLYEDPRYRYRVLLIPGTANRDRHADAAVTFLEADEDDPAASDLLNQLNVLVKNRRVEVHGKDLLKPSQVAAKVSEAIGFKFAAAYHHAKAAKYFSVWSTQPDRPDRTDQRYCVWSEPTNCYLYKKAWVDKLVGEMADPKRFEEVVGKPPKSLEAG